MATGNEIPRQLQSALEQNRCILFLGAGASMDVIDARGQKLPHWEMLLTELLNQLQDQDPDPPEVVEENQDLLSQGDFMSVSEWVDFRLGRYDFIQYLKARLATSVQSPIHDILSSKPFRAVITTNFDNLIEEHWRRRGKIPFVVIPRSSSTINTTTADLAQQGVTKLVPVIKAHGSLDNPDTLIFGPKSYRDIIFNNELFRRFISTIFSTYTVLFVGFSFRDPNFQSLLQWIYTISEGIMPTHYAFLPNRGRVFKRYMGSNYNIKIISYSTTSGNHSALMQMLQAL